jgi:hypothetical protein
MSIKQKTKKISDGNYGIWSIIAKKAIENGDEEIFISLLKDFVFLNAQGAKSLFGAKIINELKSVSEDNEGISI